MPTSLSDYFAQRVAPDPIDPTPAPTIADQDAAIDARSGYLYRRGLSQTNPLQAGFAQGTDQIGAGLTAVHGLAQAALSSTPEDQNAAVTTLRRAQAVTQADQAYTPENAGSISDAYKSGNLGDYAAYKIGSLLPGTVAAVGAGALTGGAADLAAGAIGGAARSAALDAAGNVAKDAAAEAVLPTAADAATAAATDALPAAVTPAVSQAPKLAGEFLGAGAAGAVQAAPGQVDNVLNDPGDGSSVADRAQKALAVTGVQGAIGAAPTLGLLARYGLGGAAESIAANAVEKTAPGLAQRIGANAAEQAAIGGGSAAASVAVDRAAHAWITGHPDAAPALPDYINGIADGVFGGAVFGAPAGFKGEHGVSDAIHEATGKLQDELAKRATKSAPDDSVKPGDPVNPDGTPVAGSASRQFDDNLSAVQDDPETHFDNLVKSTAPYNVKDDGTTATLNGPAASLIDPQRAAALSTVFKSPTEAAIGSMIGGDPSTLDGSSPDTGYLTQAHIGQVAAAAKAFTDGYSKISIADKVKVADFVQNTLDPQQGKLFTRVLATVDKLSPDVKSRLDYSKVNSTNDDGSTYTTPATQQGDVQTTEAPEGDTSFTTEPGPTVPGEKVSTGAPSENPFANADPDAARDLSVIPDDQWKSAIYYKGKGGPDRTSAAEENVGLVTTSKNGDDYRSDLNIKRAASALAATPEGKESLANGAGSRNLKAVMGVYAEARLRGQYIKPADIRPGLRVFPGEGGLLSPADAKTIRESFARSAAKAKLERDNPVAMQDAQTKAPPLGDKNPVRATQFKDGLNTRQDVGGIAGDGKNEANGDLQGLSEQTVNPYGAPDIRTNPVEARRVENTAIRSADKLGIKTAGRTTGEIYEDALHIADKTNDKGYTQTNPNKAAILSSVRNLSETDPGLAQHMDEAHDRKAVSDFAGERVTGDKGALIPWLKAAVAGKKPTPAQSEAFYNTKQRADNFSGMSEKAQKYARNLIMQAKAKATTPEAKAAIDGIIGPSRSAGLTEETPARGARPADTPSAIKARFDQMQADEAAAKNAVPEPARELTPDEKAAQLQAARDKQAATNEAEADTRKYDDNVKPADAPLPKTLTEAQAEAKAADDYARNPPEDFTAAKAREMAARMDAITARATESRDKLGPDHPKYDDMDEVRMNAKDAAEALRNTAKQQEISEQAHPDWFDKDVPASDQKVPNEGKSTIRDAVEKLKELPEFKAIAKSIKDLVGTVRTKADTVREGRLVSSLSKAFGTPALRIEEGTDGTPGSYKDGVITIDKNLKGAARAAVIMHEFGHHLFDTKIGGASDEVRSAMQADYQKWAAAQTGKDSFEVRASRAPLFTSLRLLDHLDGRAAEALSGKNADYLINSNEYFADQIARVLDQHEGVQSFMGKLAQNIKLAYDLARGVDPRLTNTSSAVRDWVHSLYEAPAAPDTHDSPATVSGDAPRAGSGTPHDVSATLKPQENKILYDFFSRKDIMKQLLTGADKETADALGDVGSRIETAVNEGFKKWAAGELNLVDKTALGPLKNLRDNLMKMTGITTQRELAERVLNDIKENKVDAGYNAKERIEHEKQQDLRDAGKTRQLQLRQAVAAVAHVVETKIEPINIRLMSSLDQRMRETGVPALQKLVSIVHRQTGETGEGTPLLQNINQNRAVWWDSAVKAIGAKDLSPQDQARVVDALQSKSKIDDNPELDARRQAIVDHLKAMRDYQVSKGVQLGNVEDYFPTVMDTKEVAERGDEFKALLSNPKFVEPMRDYFKAKGFDNADQLTHLDMIDKMHNMAMYKADYSLAGRSYSDTSGGSSGAPQFNLRVSEFMYKHGSPEELKQFASFQSKDLEQILIPYASTAVRNAEFTNSLGKTADMKSSTFEQLLDHARAQGASDEHIQLAKDYVDAAMGSYNPGRSQVMAKTLGAFDNVFGTKLSDVNSVQYKNLSNAIIAYQNLRTLGLGLFGNLIDPLGVWTRTSNLGQTFGAYKEAMKAIAGKGSTYAVDMAHILGTAQSHANGDALAYTYGADTSDIKSWPAKINRALFKVNGMEAITNFARVAATVAANKFLLAHAGDATNAHSARYLKELNLKPEDVAEDPAHPGYVKVTPETQRAIYQFVSESVLRPVPTQKPLWHNDPHFAVAAQYKGYLYSFYNTISARMLHEVKQGNYAGAAPVIGYMAVSMAAELAREFVQYGTAGNPNRQDWDAKNYLELAASRSGLAGPKLDVAADSIEDVRRGNIPGQSITGPSVSQAGDIIKTLAGRESVDGTIVSGLPGQSIYKGWVHGEDSDKGNKTERGEGGAESYTGSG